MDPPCSDKGFPDPRDGHLVPFAPDADVPLRAEYTSGKAAVKEIPSLRERVRRAAGPPDFSRCRRERTTRGG